MLPPLVLVLVVASAMTPMLRKIAIIASSSGSIRGNPGYTETRFAPDRGLFDQAATCPRCWPLSCRYTTASDAMTRLRIAQSWSPFFRFPVWRERIEAPRPAILFRRYESAASPIAEPNGPLERQGGPMHLLQRTDRKMLIYTLLRRVITPVDCCSACTTPLWSHSSPGSRLD